MKKKLITDDMRSLVQSAVHNGSTIKKYILSSYERIKIGCVDVVYKSKCKPEMIVNEHFVTEYSSTWRSDVGQYLMIELKKDNPELFEIKDRKFKALLKLISESDVERLKKDELQPIIIDGNAYLIIKVVSSNTPYSKYTGDYDLELDDDDLYKQDDTEIEPVKDVDSADSFALF